jgi:hypothetical protein
MIVMQRRPSACESGARHSGSSQAPAAEADALRTLLPFLSLHHTSSSKSPQPEQQGG